MRILPPTLYTAGYEAQPIELNDEIGQLSLMGEEDSSFTFDLNLETETVILNCALRPIRLERRDIRVILTTEGQTLRDALLYEEGEDVFQHTGIGIHYTGQGCSLYQGEQLSFRELESPLGQLALEDPLYIKPFKVEHEAYHESVRTFGDGRQLTTPPGLFDIRVLRGYGGQYALGTKIEEIQQVYYALNSTHEQTRIEIFPSSFLRENNMPPPLGGRLRRHQFIFHPPPSREERLSLLQALCQGFAKIKLLTNGIETTLSSFQAEDDPSNPGHINIHFRP